MVLSKALTEQLAIILLNPFSDNILLHSEYELPFEIHMEKDLQVYVWKSAIFKKDNYCF